MRYLPFILFIATSLLVVLFVSLSDKRWASILAKSDRSKFMRAILARLPLERSWDRFNAGMVVLGFGVTISILFECFQKYCDISGFAF